MHRFYLAPENCCGVSLRLDERETHHALHVLRLKPGAEVTVLDGAGNEFFCAVENTAIKNITLSIKQKTSTPAPPCPVSLFVAIPKGKIIEDIIQKAAELGANRIIPLLTERVVAQLDGAGAEAKRNKWQQTAIEAIKQCGSTWLPRVETPVALKNFLAAGELPELSLVGSLQSKRLHPREVLAAFLSQHGRKPKSVGIWIGPEGDFTLAELQAIEAAGAHPITLGKLTLRVETAAVYCLSFVNYELQRA